MATDFFEMMMSGSGLDGYKPRSALDLLISNKLTPDQNKAVQSRGRLGLAKGLLAMSGPSATPISFGQAFASGIDQMQQARSGAVDEMLKGAQIANLTDDGEVDEDVEVYMRTDKPETDFDDTKRKVLIKRSEYNKDLHVLDKPADEDNETMEVFLTSNNKDTPYDDTKTKIQIKKADYDPTLHRLELDKVEKRDLKVYPLIDNPETEIDETQQGTFIKPSEFDGTQYSADPGYQNEYLKAKKIALEIHSGDPAAQAEYIKSQVGALTANDEKLFNQKIQINDQQIFKGNLENQFAEEILNLDVKNKELNNKSKTLSNQYQELVNTNAPTQLKLDIQSKQLENLTKEINLEYLPDLKANELINLKTNIQSTKQNIDFNDKANIKKLDKMDLEIDGLILKNESTRLDNANAPIINKLQNKNLKLENLKKQNALIYQPELLKEELANIKLRNKDLAQNINFDQQNNVQLLAKNTLAVKELEYAIDNPPTDWEQIKVEGTFRREFNELPQVEAAIDSEKYYVDITKLVTKQNLNDGGDATGVDDIAIMFNYMKMLDPDSVVREGEQILLKNTENIPNQFVVAFQGALDNPGGRFLSVGQRSQILSTTQGIMADRIVNYDSQYNKYSAIAKNNFPGKDINLIMPKLDFPLFEKITTNQGVLNQNENLRDKGPG